MSFSNPVEIINPCPILRTCLSAPFAIMLVLTKGTTMGLDASVRCRCFEERKLIDPPVPYGDLYIDEDGYLWSKKLHDAHDRYDYRRYTARYGELEDRFMEWLDHPCEHEGGDYCSEWVSNIAGTAEFRDLVEELGGEETFPFLSTMLPHGNGGLYPCDKAAATLDELDHFIKLLPSVNEWVLVTVDTNEEIWSGTDGSVFPWIMGYSQVIGLKGRLVFFEDYQGNYHETAHFAQKPLSKPDNQGKVKVEIRCFDTDDVFVSYDGIAPEGGQVIEREFKTITKEAPFLYNGRYGVAERLRNLLIASLETGNPIRWC